MLQPIPYLHFNGNCIQAVRFYEQVLGGKVDLIVRFADMGCSEPMSPETGQRIAHARIVLEGGGLLFAGDCPPTMQYGGIEGVSVTLNYDTVEQAQNVFAALSEGGSVTMPMQGMMWAKAAGIVKDRFGVDWIVNGELSQN
jgi:PhnB protein